MTNLEDDRRVSKEIVLDSLKEALEKAYRKQIRADEVNVEVIIDENNKKAPIKMYQVYEVVAQDEDITDYDLQKELEEARILDPYVRVGGTVKVNVDISECGRAAAVLAKNVLKQKIREAEKNAIYNLYKDKVGDMVIGTIEAIEPKYMMINLGDALALMPKAAQLPNEIYREGQNIRVVITACEKDTKGSQLLVSRSDALLVKRLFEKDVPEIYQGIVEIKAIAREAGDRTKMAVVSHNPDVDPVGTCVGLQGARVSEVSNEIKGERIDVFEYSDNVTEFVKNALKPAEIITAVPDAENKGIIVVVNDDQLSLAIGRKGKNVRLVAKLTGKKVDIKTEDQLLADGIDYHELQQQYLVQLENDRRKRSQEAIAKLEQDAAQRAAARNQDEELDLIDDLMTNTDTSDGQEVAVDVMIEPENLQPEVEVIEEENVVEPTVEASETKEVEPVAEETAKATKVKRSLKERSERNDYVSVFETFADASRAKEEEAKVNKKRKRKGDEIERRASNADLVKDKEYSLKPFYTDEELEEIEAAQEAMDEYDDIDYDEYAEYYEDDND